jgi:hypothetical protein
MNTSIFNYTTALVPNTIDTTIDTNQIIVTKLKVNNLYLKIIKFYTDLKMTNQRVSEGKESCPVYVTWQTQYGSKILPINNGQVRYLLKTISMNTPFGRVLELSAQYLQDLKYYHNKRRNGLIYNKKYT